MVTRVRIEAEGSSPGEVEQILSMAFERVGSASPEVLDVLFGTRDPEDGRDRPGLVDAQTGEFVIERFARDCGGEAGHGAVVYRGRMTSHYAVPARVVKLAERSSMTPFVNTNSAAA